MDQKNHSSATHKNHLEKMDEPQSESTATVNRRSFLSLGSVGTATLAAFGSAAPALAQDAQSSTSVSDELEEVTIADLQAAMSSGRLTAVGLIKKYLARIENLDRHGPQVNSILE